jgi:hypothetical protein
MDSPIAVDHAYQGADRKISARSEPNCFEQGRTCDHWRLDRQLCLRAVLRLAEIGSLPRAQADATLGEDMNGDVSA